MCSYADEPTYALFLICKQISAGFVLSLIKWLIFLEGSVLAFRPLISKAGSALVAGVGAVLPSVTQAVLLSVTSGAWMLPFHPGVDAVSLQRWTKCCSAILWLGKSRSRELTLLSAGDARRKARSRVQAA